MSTAPSDIYHLHHLHHHRHRHYHSCHHPHHHVNHTLFTYQTTWCFFTGFLKLFLRSGAQIEWFPQKPLITTETNF